MKIGSHIGLMVGIILFIGCTEEEPIGNPSSGGGNTTTNWLIPVGAVLDGGPGKDGIPALLDPEFVNPSEINYITDDDLVIGYKFGDEIKAYPHAILDWHEIANDGISNNLYSIIYCPLTGTSMNWSRQIGGTSSTFGVSGLLYNSNIIPYDRSSDSNWSQMRYDCVNGPLIGEVVTFFHVVETTWGTWKKMYPDTKVMSTNTGFSRNYNRYPYTTANGDYRFDEFLLFPIENVDSRLPRKERVLGIIIEDAVRAYRFEEFKDGPGVIEDVLSGEKIVVIGSKPDNYMVAFITENDEILSPLVNGDISEGIAEDQNGNIYDAFGFVVSGPDVGKRLKITKSYLGYWFSWPAFYPNIEIYNN